MKKIQILLTVLLAFATISSYADQLPGGGTLNNPYTISSKSQWNTFIENLTDGDTSYKGKYIRLMADITVTQFVDDGEIDHYSSFKGIFDGNGHSITLNYKARQVADHSFNNYVAPFRYAEDATIMNLHVKGEIDAKDVKTPGGVIGRAKGYNRIINCRSSVTLDAHDTPNCGGFVGRLASGTTEIINCLFDGKFKDDPDESGGFVGWAASDTHLYILNSVFAPAELKDDDSSNTFFRKHTSASAILANCYYKQVWHEKPQTDYGAIDATTKTVAELLEGLGGGWHMEGNAVVPSYFNIYGDFVGAGTQESPYLIASVDHWNALAFRIRNGESFSGKYFQLLADLPVSLQLGYDASHPFSGNFDGRGRTITFTRTGAAAYCAPFRYVKNATIRDVRTKGTIYTDHKEASGLVGMVDGSLSLNRCWSSVKIDSRIDGDGTHGGLIARGEETATTITVTDALFDGSFHQGKDTEDPGNSVTSTHCGGLVGWANTPITFTNCLFNPETVSIGSSGAQKIVRYDSGANPTFVQTYYISSWGGGNQGSDASGMAVDNLVAALGANWWKNSSGKAVLKPVENPDFAGSGTQTDPYLITSVQDWVTMETKNAGETPFPAGSYFKLVADITISSPAGASEDKPFKYHFDGGGHTLNLDFNTTNSVYTAPFGYIQNAHLSNLVLTGSVSTTGMRPSGLVGFVRANSTNTILNCRSSVAISSSRAGDVDGGAFVATVESNSNITITGCVFTGTVLYTNNGGYEGGGLIGWARSFTDNNYHVNLVDCLFAPATFEAKAGTAPEKNYLLVGGDINSNSDVSLTRCFYNHVAYNQTEIESKHGFDPGALHACAISVGSDHVNVEYGTPTVYDVAGITAYDGGGFVFDGVPYGPGGGSITLTITSDSFSQFFGFDGPAEAPVHTDLLTGAENPYTLAFYHEDVTIMANFGTIILYEDRDNTELLNGANSATSVVTMKRTMLAGVWNSFCAPFDLTADQISSVFGAGTVVKALTSATYNSVSGALTLAFSTVSAITAGHPYLIKIGSSTNNVVDPNFGSVTIKNVKVPTEFDDVADFVPVFGITPENGKIDTSLAGSDENVLFIAGDGSLSYPDADGNIKAFRAYIKLK